MLGLLRLDVEKLCPLILVVLRKELCRSMETGSSFYVKNFVGVWKQVRRFT